MDLKFLLHRESLNVIISRVKVAHWKIGTELWRVVTCVQFMILPLINPVTSLDLIFLSCKVSPQRC